MDPGVATENAAVTLSTALKSTPSNILGLIILLDIEVHNEVLKVPFEIMSWNSYSCKYMAKPIHEGQYKLFGEVYFDDILVDSFQSDEFEPIYNDDGYEWDEKEIEQTASGNFSGGVTTETGEIVQQTPNILGAIGEEEPSLCDPYTEDNTTGYISSILDEEVYVSLSNILVDELITEYTTQSMEEDLLRIIAAIESERESTRTECGVCIDAMIHAAVLRMTSQEVRDSCTAHMDDMMCTIVQRMAQEPVSKSFIQRIQESPTDEPDNVDNALIDTETRAECASHIDHLIDTLVLSLAQADTHLTHIPCESLNQQTEEVPDAIDSNKEMHVEDALHEEKVRAECAVLIDDTIRTIVIRLTQEATTPAHIEGPGIEIRDGVAAVEEMTSGLEREEKEEVDALPEDEENKGAEPEDTLEKVTRAGDILEGDGIDGGASEEPEEKASEEEVKEEHGDEVIEVRDGGMIGEREGKGRDDDNEEELSNIATAGVVESTEHVPKENQDESTDPVIVEPLSGSLPAETEESGSEQAGYYLDEEEEVGHNLKQLETRGHNIAEKNQSERYLDATLTAEPVETRDGASNILVSAADHDFATRVVSRDLVATVESVIVPIQLDMPPIAGEKDGVATAAVSVDEVKEEHGENVPYDDQKDDPSNILTAGVVVVESAEQMSREDQAESADPIVVEPLSGSLPVKTEESGSEQDGRGLDEREVITSDIEQLETMDHNVSEEKQREQTLNAASTLEPAEMMEESSHTLKSSAEHNSDTHVASRDLADTVEPVIVPIQLDMAVTKDVIVKSKTHSLDNEDIVPIAGESDIVVVAAAAESAICVHVDPVVIEVKKGSLAISKGSAARMQLSASSAEDDYEDDFIENVSEQGDKALTAAASAEADVLRATNSSFDDYAMDTIDLGRTVHLMTPATKKRSAPDIKAGNFIIEEPTAARDEGEGEESEERKDSKEDTKSPQQGPTVEELAQAAELEMMTREGQLGRQREAVEESLKGNDYDFEVSAYNSTDLHMDESSVVEGDQRSGPGTKPSSRVTSVDHSLDKADNMSVYVSQRGLVDEKEAHRNASLTSEEKFSRVYDGLNLQKKGDDASSFRTYRKSNFLGRSKAENEEEEREEVQRMAADRDAKKSQGLYKHASVLGRGRSRDQDDELQDIKTLIQATSPVVRDSNRHATLPAKQLAAPRISLAPPKEMTPIKPPGKATLQPMPTRDQTKMKALAPVASPLKAPLGRRDSTAALLQTFMNMEHSNPTSWSMLNSMVDSAAGDSAAGSTSEGKLTMAKTLEENRKLKNLLQRAVSIQHVTSLDGVTDEDYRVDDETVERMRRRVRAEKKYEQLVNAKNSPLKSETSLRVQSTKPKDVTTASSIVRLASRDRGIADVRISRLGSKDKSFDVSASKTASRTILPRQNSIQQLQSKVATSLFPSPSFSVDANSSIKRLPSKQESPVNLSKPTELPVPKSIGGSRLQPVGEVREETKSRRHSKPTELPGVLSALAAKPILKGTEALFMYSSDSKANKTPAKSSKARPRV